MPAPIATTPSAQTPTNPNSFFVPQNTSGPIHNLTESPVLSSPTSPQKSAGNKSGISASPFAKKKILIGAGILVAVLTLVGGAAGLYLSRTSEDNRQQASTPSGSAQISLSPDTGTLQGNSVQQVAVGLNLTTTPVTISSIILSIAFSGQVPANIDFRPITLQNFQPATVNFTDTETGKTLVVTYTPSGSQGFSATTSRVNLGNLTFTNPNAGQLNVRFNASESKVILAQSKVDILRPPSLVSYNFQSADTQAAVDNQVVDQASESGNTILDKTASLSAQNALVAENATPSPTGRVFTAVSSTPTATPTTAVLAQLNSTSTPTRTPAPTATTAVANSTLTPVPTSSRQSSLPANTQKPPVSGSVDVTMELIVSGGSLIAAGFYLANRNKKQALPEQKHNAK